jgi:hypothetical protein
MKIMKKAIALTTLVVCFFCCLSAQENAKHKIKLYETWVSLNNQVSPLRGVLYEIKDSSILISNSLWKPDYLTGNLKVTGFSYNNISVIKTRRTKNIQRGLLIGSAAGFGFGVIFIPRWTETQGMGILTATTAIAGGFIYGILGAGIGTLVGSTRDRIPIKGSWENFNLYRSALQDYSYMQEYPGSVTRFEHKWFAGITAGLSIPSGDYAETGSYGNFFLGYRFTRNIGISFSDFSNDYPVRSDFTTSYWGLGGITIGPVISFPVRDKLYFDLKPGIGYANAYLVVDDIETKNGNGLGISFNTSLTCNFSKRWGFVAEAGFLSAQEKFEDSSKEKFQYVNLDFGFMYKFGKRSL